MRLAIAFCAAALAACGNTGPCQVDSDCASGEQCARTEECLASSEIRAVRAEWTVNGAPASETACIGQSSLLIRFLGDFAEDDVGYAPVPCKLGVFTLDKLPTRFDRAELGPESGGLPVGSSIDGDGHARFDL